MQPSLQASFPLLQDQEEHKDDKCLSLALEQHEGLSPLVQLLPMLAGSSSLMH